VPRQLFAGEPRDVVAGLVVPRCSERGAVDLAELVGDRSGAVAVEDLDPRWIARQLVVPPLPPRERRDDGGRPVSR
jgi:hypothetical protein